MKGWGVWSESQEWGQGAVATEKAESPSRLLGTFLVPKVACEIPRPGLCPSRLCLPSVKLTHSLCSLTSPVAPLGSHSGHLIGALDAQRTSWNGGQTGGLSKAQWG